ncbi:lipase family protein [Paenibacillus sp. DMB20]|uniref:lipase family protein n=1 Tax=Paenibacillus sp. DMB20 TaxID=1642570 RepID=UPI0019111942
MSEAAYLDLEKGDTIEDLPGWEVLEDFESKAISGFDAVTFVNPDTKQAVIAFRGTEGDRELPHMGPDILNDIDIGLGEIGRKMEIKRPFDEQLTQFEDAVGITAFKDWAGETSKEIDKFVQFPGTNQLYQAEDYTNEMTNKYKDYDFTLTGHSLGGGNAQYAAAYTGLDAVTFSAPSVVGSLTPEARRRAENGEFDSQIINFAHPGDIIASGALGGYDGHVGSTYYIDSNYEDANEGVGIKEKIDNTLGGPNYHQLDRYKFENGYISNPLYDGASGERVDSPRVPSDYSFFDGLMDTMQGFADTLSGLPGLATTGLAGLASLAGGSAASAGTIQVTPAELRSVAERWKLHARQSHAELEGIRQRLSRYMYSSHSRRLQPIVQQLDASIVSMSQWHMQHTNDIVYFIQHKADQFEQADNTG